MCIEENIRNAETFIKKGLYISAFNYIDRVKEELAYNFLVDLKKGAIHVEKAQKNRTLK